MFERDVASPPAPSLSWRRRSARSVCYYAVRSGYKLWGVPYNTRERDMAMMIYIFFVSKIYEFMDTIVMLLKRNVQQVTVLHVYHHASISFIWWMIAHTAPGGDAYFSAALNSFVVRRIATRLAGVDAHASCAARADVHVLHGCAAGWEGAQGARAASHGIARLRTDSTLSPFAQTRERWLWWGRYLTQFQMAQFFANLVQAAYCWRYSPYPRFLSKLLFWYMISLLALFGAPASVMVTAWWLLTRCCTGEFYHRKHVKGAKEARLKKSAGSKKRA